MKNIISAVCTATLAATIGFSTDTPAAAAPATTMLYKVSPDIQSVQYRRDTRRGHWNGNQGYRERRDGYRRHNDGYWYPLVAFGAGAIIGGALTNGTRREQVVEIDDQSANWCANRYRSYRAYDNTYQPNNGPRQQCRSPY